LAIAKSVACPQRLFIAAQSGQSKRYPELTVESAGAIESLVGIDPLVGIESMVGTVDTVGLLPIIVELFGVDASSEPQPTRARPTTNDAAKVEKRVRICSFSISDGGDTATINTATINTATINIACLGGDTWIPENGDG
jgi:hypothetical protein